jgi:hypothetical protein
MCKIFQNKNEKKRAALANEIIISSGFSFLVVYLLFN